MRGIHVAYLPDSGDPVWLPYKPTFRLLLWNFNQLPITWVRRVALLDKRKVLEVNMYQIGNIYIITAISVIGGGLFGFDISSMSAMYA